MTRHRRALLPPERPADETAPFGVILAEDDPLLRGLIRSTLLRAGQEVFPVVDGLEAVMKAGQIRARMVLLDISMPRLNGLVACEAIRSLPGYAEVPILMLTGYNDSRLRRVARRLGATDFIAKPFQPSELLSRIASYIDVQADVDAPDEGALIDMPVPTPRKTDGRKSAAELASEQNYQREIWKICRDAEHKA